MCCADKQILLVLILPDHRIEESFRLLSEVLGGRARSALACVIRSYKKLAFEPYGTHSVSSACIDQNSFGKLVSSVLLFNLKDKFQFVASIELNFEKRKLVFYFQRGKQRS